MTGEQTMTRTAWEQLAPAPLLPLVPGVRRHGSHSAPRVGAEAQALLIETAETKRSDLGGMTLERWATRCDQLVDLRVIAQAPLAAA